MYVDRILFPVTALGPGKRIAIWMVGCHRKCLGCANPELWIPKATQKINVTKLANLIRNTVTNKGADGLTISGGEPFEQSEELLALLKSIANLKLNTLVFSGFKMEELMQRDDTRAVLKYVDVLIDGEYIKELNDGKSTLLGSSNQRINILNPKCRDSVADYVQKGRQIQNFVYGNMILSVGIHSEDKMRG